MKTLCFGFLAMDKNSPLEQGGERARWEHHHVTLGRVSVVASNGGWLQNCFPQVPGYGFGIAMCSELDLLKGSSKSTIG
ncbi:hypothetical protein MRX96_039671 [Rhipicephalus microplus]